MKKLPPKQRLFLKEWRIDKNASKAYIRAFKYKGKNANVLGPELLANLGKKNLIEPEIVAQEQKAIITADEVLTELRYISKQDMADIYDKDGNILPIPQMPEHIRRAISSVEFEDGPQVDADGVVIGPPRVKKIKFWDKNKGLETTARHLRMLVDRVEVQDVDSDIDFLTDEQLALVALGKALPGDFKKK